MERLLHGAAGSLLCHSHCCRQVDMQRDAIAVVLAGGEDKRLYPLANDSVLVPVGNKPLLHYPLRALAASGLKRAFVVCHVCYFCRLMSAHARRGVLIGVDDRPLRRWYAASARRHPSPTGYRPSLRPPALVWNARCEAEPGHEDWLYHTPRCKMAGSNPVCTCDQTEAQGKLVAVCMTLHAI